MQSDNTTISPAVYEYVKKARICSRHFDCEPSQDIRSPDYIPHINLGYTPKRYYLESLLPPSEITTTQAEATIETDFPLLETALMKDMFINMAKEDLSAGIYNFL